jgi:hypothetical protein
MRDTDSADPSVETHIQKQAPPVAWSGLRLLARGIASATLALALLCAAGSPRFASAEEPSIADRERARDLMLEGRLRRHEHDLKAAIESFQQAHAIMGVPLGVPSSGLELASTQAEAGLLLEARQTLRAVLAYPQRADEPEAFARARVDAARLEAELSSVIPRLRVLCHVPSPARCEVSLDGQLASTTAPAATLELNPGHHRVGISAIGKSEDFEFDIAESELKEIKFEASPAAPSPPSARPAALPAPTSPAAPETTSLVPALSLGALLAGGAGLVVGTITGLNARAASNDLRERCPDNACSASDADRIDRGNRWATASTVSFAVGGVLSAAGLVGLVWAWRRPNATAASGSITPWVSLSSAGAQMDF